ncbi:Bug family tripartite tricarboxylate transporter substrate binding protein [Roseomonas sp. BN140053]|uniref:Bug family tripartite tricarboxylate transporter substrate binding protein n=1 Tax=Roseomonas sp. BN140053 TaxID=3391898 RepID=UPI0039ED4FF6
MRRRGLLAAGASLASARAGLVSPALAQFSAFPERAIRLVVPWASGTAASNGARLTAAAMSAGLGVAVNCDPRPGAYGLLGVDLAAHAEPDGYTLLFAGTVNFTRPLLDRDPPFDPDQVFDAVGPVGEEAFLLCARPGLPRDLRELIATARRGVGSLNVASSGVGSTSHMVAEFLVHAAQLDAVHIPYRTPVQALRDLITGRVDLYCEAVSTLVGPLSGNRIQPVAVTNAGRTPLLPAVPTVAEAALPGFAAAPWWGIVGPAGLPEEARTRVAAELRHVLGQPGLQAALGEQGCRAFTMTSAEFGTYLRQESRRWAAAVEAGELRTG